MIVHVEGVAGEHCEASVMVRQFVLEAQVEQADRAAAVGIVELRPPEVIHQCGRQRWIDQPRRRICAGGPRPVRLYAGDPRAEGKLVMSRERVGPLRVAELLPVWIDRAVVQGSGRPGM